MLNDLAVTMAKGHFRDMTRRYRHFSTMIGRLLTYKTYAMICRIKLRDDLSVRS